MPLQSPRMCKCRVCDYVWSSKARQPQCPDPTGDCGRSRKVIEVGKLESDSGYSTQDIDWIDLEELKAGPYEHVSENTWREIDSHDETAEPDTDETAESDEPDTDKSDSEPTETKESETAGSDDSVSVAEFITGDDANMVTQEEYEIQEMGPVKAEKIDVESGESVEQIPDESPEPESAESGGFGVSRDMVVYGIIAIVLLFLLWYVFFRDDGDGNGGGKSPGDMPGAGAESEPQNVGNNEGATTESNDGKISVELVSPRSRGEVPLLEPDDGGNQ